MKKSFFALSLFSSFLLVAEVNIYSVRHYDADNELYKLFEQKTGIKVNATQAKAGPFHDRPLRVGALASSRPLRPCAGAHAIRRTVRGPGPRPREARCNRGRRRARRTFPWRYRPGGRHELHYGDRSAHDARVRPDGAKRGSCGTFPQAVGQVHPRSGQPCNHAHARAGRTSRELVRPGGRQIGRALCRERV